MVDLDNLLLIDLDDPEQALAHDLVEEDGKLMDNLVAARKARKLTQTEVAEKLGVTQPTVAAFERLGSDPRLSTIRRYALAVGVRVSHKVVQDGRTAEPAETATPDQGLVDAVHTIAANAAALPLPDSRYRRTSAATAWAARTVVKWAMDSALAQEPQKWSSGG